MKVVFRGSQFKSCCR